MTRILTREEQKYNMGYWLTSRMASGAKLPVAELLAMLAVGTLVPVVNHIYPLEQAREAQRALGRHDTLGKVVFSV